MTDSFGTYKVPTVRDIPNELSVTLLDRDDVTHCSEVYSSKGIGEPPLMLCAAVTSAVRQALTSFRNDQVRQIYIKGGKNSTDVGSIPGRGIEVRK